MRTLVCLLLLSLPTLAADPVPLFNGKDLSGWHNVNCAPKTFYVKDQQIITNGSPTGFLRTDKQYENFILEVDWMHVEPKRMANSGIFVWGDPIPAIGSPYTRGIEVQVLINFKPEDGWATSHGDLFSIWGAKCKPDRPHPKGLERCLPSEDRAKGAGEWNHYKIIANDGSIKLHVNGKEVSGVSQCNPRKGYIALESEGAECHFKNITIQELPSTNPKPDEIADVAAGHKSLFDGLSFTGWNATDGWKAGGVMRCSTDGDLTSAKPLGAGELLFDWKLPAKAKQELTIDVGGATKTVTLPEKGKAGSWHRYKVNIESEAPFTIHGQPGLEIMNIFHAAK